MASPVGHALVGLGLSAAVAEAMGTPVSPGLWLGAIVASGLPDLDLIGVMFGLSRHRVHRYATHSLLVLGALIFGAALLLTGLQSHLEAGLGLAWGAALFSHPLIDLMGTGPAMAASGYGVALFWPFSSRRWFLREAVFPPADITTCRTAAEIWKAVSPEVIHLGPAAAVLILIGHLL